MSWTRSILNFAGGKPYHLYHLLSVIACAFAWFIIIEDSFTYLISVPLAAVLGFLTLLAWEFAQWIWDTGFQLGDIRSNAIGAGLSIPLLSIILLARWVLYLVL